MTPYQLLLLAILILWPGVIFGLLMLMSRLEDFVKRSDAGSPQAAGIEPVTGSTSDPEVKIVFGDTVVGERDG
jgi:hypothetical protein